MSHHSSHWIASGLTDQEVLERDYSGSSEVVKEAIATLREHREKRATRIGQYAATFVVPLLLAMATYGGGLFLSLGEGAAPVAVGIGVMAFMSLMMLAQRGWQGDLRRAREVLGQFERLKQLGVEAPTSPVVETRSSTDAMMARIRKLSEDDPRTLASAETIAAHIKKVEEELAHLSELVDEHDLEIALGSTRQTLTTDLEHTRGQLASLYGALAERSAATATPVIELGDIVDKVEAEREVNGAMRAAHRRQREQ